MLIDLQRLAGALRWRADVLIDLLRRVIPPLRRRPSVARPTAPARRGAAQPRHVRVRTPPVPKARRVVPARPSRPIPRPRIPAPRPHVPVSTPRHATPARVSTRILPRQPHRPRPVLSPLERTALYAEARRQVPVAMEVFPPLARQRPHPHARILRALRVQQQARPRPVLRPRRIAAHIVTAPHIRVPAPPYYVRFAPIR